MSFSFEEGETLLFDKPLGWSSFDLVRKVRNIIRVKKVGHAGTLDPLATGLMILCTGKHTKTIDGIQGQEKTYKVTFCLGATTPSYDAEFPPENIQDTAHITQAMVEAEMQHFVGEISQIPPQFSAVQVGGKRAYDLARKGETVELKARIVHVYQFELTEYQSPAHIVAIVKCSKGTYIRSLVHDLGQRLGVGAYMTGLVRTEIGNYQLQHAWTIEAFEKTVKGESKE